MKNRLKLLAVLALALATSQTKAANWIELNSIGNEFRLYYDSSSLHSVKKTFVKTQFYQAWFKQEIVNDLNMTDNLVVGDYVLNLWRFDCTGHRIGLVKSLYYKQNGQYLNQTVSPYVSMSQLIPDTAGELMLSNVCGSVNELGFNQPTAVVVPTADTPVSIDPETNR